MIYKRIVLLFLTVIFVITGCESPALYNQSENNAADTFQKIKDVRHQADAAGKPQSPLLVNQGLYVDNTPVSLTREPSWLKGPIIIRGNNLPFSYFSSTIIGGNGHLLVHYNNGVDTTQKISISYSGSIKGALDLLASKTGYIYKVHGNHVYWDAFVTRTYDIAFMPGTTDYQLGDASSSAQASSTSSSGSSGTTSGGITGGAGQNSSLKGSLSIWKDIDSAIKAMLSSEGKVIVSQATTNVTVRDKPANIALITKYIENLNKNLSRQVLVKIQILQVSLSNSFSYGIDWNIVQGAFGGSNAILNANYGTPVSISTLTSATTLPQAGLQIMNNGRTTGFTILVNALKQQGKVAIVTEPRVVCLNNQVSVINIVTKTAYAASVSSTALAGGNTSNGSSVTSSITPGTVVTGLVLYILPKIMGNKVYLDVNADLSTLVQLQTFISGEGGSSPASIETPTTNEEEFNQRSMIASGDTLILAGLRQVSNTLGANQLLDSQALGGKAAAQTDAETIVLITPIILNGSA